MQREKKHRGTKLHFNGPTQMSKFYSDGRGSSGSHLGLKIPFKEVGVIKCL